MTLAIISKSIGLSINKLVRPSSPEKNFNYLIIKNEYSTPCQQSCKAPPCTVKPPNIYEPQSFWDKIFNRKRLRKPPKENCRLLACEGYLQTKEIPQQVQDIVKNTPGGELYRTQGVGYILEVPKKLKKLPCVKSQEDVLISKIETHKDQKKAENIYNPMPIGYHNPCLRMIDLQNRKLHPLYRKYESTLSKPKNFFNFAQSDIFENIQEPKNQPKGSLSIYAKKKVCIEYKMAQLPRYITQKTKERSGYSGMDIRIVRNKYCHQKGKFPHINKCPKPDCKKLAADKTKEEKENTENK